MDGRSLNIHQLRRLHRSLQKRRTRPSMVKETEEIEKLAKVLESQS